MKRVLVVDDDSQVLALMGRWLSTAGYDVVMTDNFKDACKQIQRKAPDVAVIDVRLADYNGLQLGMLAREAQPDVRLVFVSGWDDAVLRRDAAELNATYIQKPLLNAAELLAVVDSGQSRAAQRRAVSAASHAS